MSTSSAVLAAQLQNLKKQQEELEKRIQDEAETRKKLNNKASIERLEALVKPITETLDFIDPNNTYGNTHASKSERMICMEGLKHTILVYNSEMDRAKTQRRAYPRPIRRNRDLENEEILVTIIGILKKQDKRIKELEDIINNT